MNNKEYGVKLSADISDIEKKIEKVKELTKKTAKETKVTLFEVPEGYKKIGRDIMETEKHFLERLSKIKVKINAPTTDERYKQFEPKDYTKAEGKSYFSDTDKIVEDNYKKAKEAGVSVQEWINGIEKVKQSTAETTAQMEPLKNRATEIRQEIEKLAEAYKEITTHKFGQLFSIDDTKNAEDIENKVNELLDELEEIEGQEFGVKGIADLDDELNNAENETNDLKNAFSDLGDKISNSIGRGIKSIKRFSLSLFGIHSIWTALSRAVRSYMAYDEKANARIQANWVALGAMFAPIVETIVGWIQKLVAYINVFYKALTGKSFIQTALDKVRAKADKTGKAVGGLNKQLANFDEITNLNFDMGDKASDFDIASALEELDKIELDPKIVKTIEELAENLKKFYEDYIKPIGKAFEDWGIDLGDVVFIGATLWGALKLTSIYNDVAKIIGVSGGTTGFLGLLTVFGMLIDFQLAYKLGQELATLVDVLDEQKSAEERLGASQILIMNTAKSRIEEINKLLEDQNLTEEQRKKLEEEKGEKIEAYKKAYEDFNIDVAEGKKRSAEQKKEVEALGKELDKITKTHYTADVDLKVKAKAQDSISQKIINFMFGGLYGYLNDWNLFGIDITKGRGFAKGNVAYGPTVAEFGEYAGARSNPEITAPQSIMKQTMIEALQEANLSGNNNNKGGDTILYVNGKELARATYGDFESERNRLGTSNVAIRRV